jgi:hypothetical protein
MRVKTPVKAGSIIHNHNEALVRAGGLMSFDHQNR